MPIYAGIGSRRTPPHILELMTECGRLLAAGGWTLRSGGADGADTAFANGAYECAPKVEIYLPWGRYNEHRVARLYSPTAAAYTLSGRHHPAWDRLSPEERTLHARNAHIILGPNLDDPVRMVVCWTPDGSLNGRGPKSGGTGQALRIAVSEAPRAEVFNLAREDHRTRVWKFIGSPPMQGGAHAGESPTPAVAAIADRLFAG